MNRFFYAKLALINIKKNRQTYVPYLLTCIATVMMFYVLHAISSNKGLRLMPGFDNLRMILSMGGMVILIFSVIFLLYTNSFLIKRRKKELGLFNVLGMEKKHIAWVLCFESLFTSLINLILGLVGGMILNKLIFVLLLRLLQFDIPLGFEINIESIEFTLQVFIGIFILTLICNLVQIVISKPIELLKGGQVGEKEPKTKWVGALIGVVSLAIGYGIALSVESPLEALNHFFIAVIFVIIGTYQLFTAGSVAVLKLLRKNKCFYYQSQHFIAISGMMYRMKQNAKGLANICILSTAVLVMISTTVALYVGMEDLLRYRFPKDVFLIGREITQEDSVKINELLDEKRLKYEINVQNSVNYWSQSRMAIEKGSTYTVEGGTMNPSDVKILSFISLEDYNRFEEKNVTLADDEVMVFGIVEDYPHETMTIDHQTYQVKEVLDSIRIASKNKNEMVQTYLVITNEIETFSNQLNTYEVSFDVNNSDEETIVFVNELNTEFHQRGIKASIDSIANNRDDFFVTYGGLFFLGIFLGTLFLIATVLIIYYKQISEGFDDKERFNIMQRVGMSKQEIKKTIRIQVLMVFFLPLVFSAIHIAFAFPIITKLLAVLNLANQQLFLITTIGSIVVFGIIYSLIFILTARTYYKIVE